MKDLVRLRTSLSEEIESILNEQIQREAKASAAYLAMATWCDNRGFTNSADFFYHQSGEEREHMMKIYKYVNDVGGRSVSPEITGIQYDFDSLRSVFEEALDQEVTNTQSINRLVDACYKLKDYPTIEFMQWFLKEQVEEEFVARRHLELFDVIGTEGVGLYMIDKQIPKTKYEEQ